MAMWSDWDPSAQSSFDRSEFTLEGLLFLLQQIAIYIKTKAHVELSEGQK